MTQEGTAERDMDAIRQNLDTSRIKEWRSIVTLIVFVLTNILVLFPFRLPLFVPRIVYNAVLSSLVALRLIPKPRNNASSHQGTFIRLSFPINFVTAPLIADLFLLAILAIGREEVKGGTLGANNISPLDIMLFFVSLAYIAISIDASGLIKYLAFRVLTWGGDAGHRLFFYLYSFFFALTAFIGNDPIILSGTPFLAYMTRVSSNIVHPRAWIYSQFAVANIASAILVSSNPTNLVVAGAFGIKFIHYSANVIVPVITTGIVLFPCLLYVVFRNESLIPHTIEMHQLPDEAREAPPRNPNIPKPRDNSEEGSDNTIDDEKILPLDEIMNPYLDKTGAWFGSVVMAATLITVLSINAAASGKQHVFWVTLPAAVVMFLFDLIWGWLHRYESRRIAREGEHGVDDSRIAGQRHADLGEKIGDDQAISPAPIPSAGGSDNMCASPEAQQTASKNANPRTQTSNMEDKIQAGSPSSTRRPRTLQSIIVDTWRWSRETFPTATTVLMHLPLTLVPFAFCMFILVQALVTKGWIQVFAYGWDHWVNKTGTIGAIGGMGFLSVILCNFAGTNIGTTILLSRVIQAWQDIHRVSGSPISDRTFWATVYSLAISVNYGAFSIAFSASLAGLLWRDILARKHIRVRSLDFVRVNVPIIAVTMVVGCTVLVGQVWVVRDGRRAYDE